MLIALLALSFITGCRTPEQSVGETGALIPAVQSDLMPKLGVKYKLVTPPMIYRSKAPGPKEREPQKAWRLGNEFVFRTALRSFIALPAIEARHITNDVFVVGFRTPKGKEAGLFLVYTDSNEIEISE
jgi:hypothetical protein